MSYSQCYHGDSDIDKGIGVGLGLVFVVSDTQCGSTVGLCPPEVTVEGGGNYQANVAQRWLWECWEDVTGCMWRPRKKRAEDEMPGEISPPGKKGWMERTAGGREYAIVILGDAIEGCHHKQVEVIGNDVALHAAIARHIFGALVENASRVFVVRGTEVHVGTVENGLGQHVGGKYCRATKSFAWEQLQLKVRGVLSHFKHHISVSMRPWTTSMQFAAAIASEQLNAIGLDHSAPRVVCRAHRHQYGEWRNNQGLVVVSPPWQLLTRFARKVTQASLSQPGMFALDYDDMDHYGLPRVHAKLYRPDADRVVSI